MQIKSILAAAAIALAATIGSASAAEEFTTLEGVQAQPMNAAAMEAVRGMGQKANGNATNVGTAAALAEGTDNGASATFDPLWLGNAHHVL